MLKNVSPGLIENVKDLKISLNELTVYDFDVYSSIEVYYKIAHKLNDIIRELSRFEGLVSEEVIKQNDKLIYLLDEGLENEVIKEIDNLIKQNFFNDLVNVTFVKELNNRMDNVSSQLEYNANYFENKKMDKNGIISMANIGQDVKTALTGGSVAIVGKNTILRENVVDNEITFKKLNDNIKGNFEVNYEPIVIKFTKGGFWDYDNGNLTDHDEHFSYSEEISVRAGDDFIISGCSSYRANLYIIKDSNGSVIEIFPNTNEGTQIYNDIKFTIPLNGVKLCLNSIADSPTKISKLSDINVNGDKIIFKHNTIEKDVLDSKISNLFTDVYSEISLDWIDGGYYRFENLEIREDGNASRVKIDVSEGEKYEISGTSYWEANLYYITNKNNEIISTFPNTNQTSTQYKNIRFIIPEGGKYLYINQRNNNLLTTLKTLTGYEVVTKQIYKKWVTFGDSLTDSNTLGDKPNYTDIIANKLGLELVNLGKGGTGYINNNGGNQQFYNRTFQIPTKTDVLTVFGSFNDLYVNDIPNGTITDTEPTTLYGAINKFLSNCWAINPDMVIGIISPTPWSGWWRGHSDSSKVEKCVNYVNVLKTVAEYYSLPFLDLFSHSNLRPWDSKFNEKYYLNADGVHPNTEGHKLIAPKIENFIKTIIQNYN